jgi:hypothetical protein
VQEERDTCKWAPSSSIPFPSIPPSKTGLEKEEEKEKEVIDCDCDWM